MKRSTGTRILTCLAPAALTLSALAGGGGQIIFDEFAPDDDNGTIPPGRYAGIGVIFAGTDDSSTWGGLDNGDPGNWSLNGTAGPVFAGFNGASYGVTIRFLSNVTGVTLDAARANGSVDGVITVDGYRNGMLMDSQTVTLGAINKWTTIAVGGLLDELVISGTGDGFHPFGVDNLRWQGAGACPWDFDGDGVVGPSDLASLLAAWNSPFGPAELAALLAAWGPCDPCGPGAGPCNAPNGSPGCQDVECCQLVCSMDPFCCDVVWDQLCADQALDVCFPCCQPGDLPEGEPCGEDTNGGCNSTPPVFREAQCNASYCGSAWAADGTRDTDWYRLTLTDTTLVTATLASEFDGVIFILDGLDTCAPVVVGSTGSSINCDPIGAA